MSDPVYNILMCLLKAFFLPFEKNFEPIKNLIFEILLSEHEVISTFLLRNEKKVDNFQKERL